MSSKPNTPSRDPSEHPKQSGELTETRVHAELLARGFRVLTPLGESEYYDAIVDDGERELHRVQIKTGRIEEREDGGSDVVIFHCCRYDSTGESEPYPVDDPFDAFLVYVRELDLLLWVPREDANKYNMQFRIETDRPRRSRRNYVADYEI